MVVGRDRRDLRVGHRDLRVERGELQVLLVFLGAVMTSSEGEDHRVLALQLAQLSHGVRVVRQLVVGKHCAGNDVWSHDSLYTWARSRVPSMWSVAFLAASSTIRKPLSNAKSASS